jgi:hypothetical protein
VLGRFRPCHGVRRRASAGRFLRIEHCNLRVGCAAFR